MKTKNNRENEQGLTKTERLRALRVRRDAVLAKIKDLDEPTAAGEFSRLTAEIEALADTFLLYQGREIEARKVNYLHGTIPTATEDLDGDEDLYCDKEGRYYLRRQLSHSERAHVHRLSPTAAILWACTRLNSETLTLRLDAAARLRLSQRHPDVFAALDERACGLLLEKLSGQSRLDPRDVLNGAVDFLLCDPHAEGNPDSGEEAVAWAKERRLARETEGEEAAIEALVPVTVQMPPKLFRLVAAMAECDGRGGVEAAILHSLEGDALAFLEAEDARLPRLLAACGIDQKEAARELRALLHAEESEEDSQSSDDALMATAQQPFTPDTLRLPEHGPIRLSLELLPTEEECGERFALNYDAQRADQVRSLAQVFGLPAEDFLLKLLARALPGQPQQTHGSLADSLCAEHIAFACFEPAMLRRIEAVAAYNGQTVDGFVAGAVGGHVDAHEQDCIAHPETGELLAEESELRPDLVRYAPPLGMEEHPAWRNIGQKRRWVGDAAVPSLLSLLDAGAAKLVRRYLEATPSDYTPQDVVGGAVRYALEAAFDDLADAHNHALASRGREFADDVWGYVEADVCRARRLRQAIAEGKAGELMDEEDAEAGQPVYADSAEASGIVEAEAEVEEELQAVAAAVRQVAPEQRDAFHEKLRSALTRIVKRLKGERAQG